MSAQGLRERIAGLCVRDTQGAQARTVEVLLLLLACSLPLYVTAGYALLKKVASWSRQRSTAPPSPEKGRIARPSPIVASDSRISGYEMEPSKATAELPSVAQTALLIRKRRSVFTKDFSGAAVDRSIVEAMLEAANWAPTHGKTEPWRFVVLNAESLQDFIGVMIEAVREGTEARRDEKIAKLESKRRKLRSVAWAIAICFKRQAGEKLMPEWEELAATAAAVQNMHLTATAAGAAGYWTSWGPEEARESPRAKAWLGLEAQDRCIGVFLLGASDAAGGYRSSRGPIAEKVQWRV